jgi:hypothetical protein
MILPARRRSIDLAVAGAGTACTAVRVNQCSLYSPTHSCSCGCAVPDCPSTGQSRRPPQPQTAGWGTVARASSTQQQQKILALSMQSICS